MYTISGVMYIIIYRRKHVFKSMFYVKLVSEEKTIMLTNSQKKKKNKFKS